MLRNIDAKSTGYVNYRTLMTYIILLRSKVPSAKEFARIEKLFKDGEVDRESFAKASFWFEESEQSVDRENAVAFERVQMIKQLLWQKCVKLFKFLPFYAAKLIWLLLLLRLIKLSNLKNLSSLQHMR